MLRALRESDGGAVAVEDAELEREAELATREEGVDFSPEGGAALAAVARAARQREPSGRATGSWPSTPGRAGSTGTRGVCLRSEPRPYL